MIRLTLSYLVDSDSLLGGNLPKGLCIRDGEKRRLPHQEYGPRQAGGNGARHLQDITGRLGGFLRRQAGTEEK